MLIQKYFETRLAQIENELGKYLDFNTSKNSELRKALDYAIFSGGKRWRPLLVIAIYEMLTGTGNNCKLESILPAACSIELMHNASIVHNDLPLLMNNKERRGNKSLCEKYDNSIAILAGDALFTLAFEVLTYINNFSNAIQCTQILAKHSNTYGTIGGQAVDYMNKRKVMKISTLRYIDMKKVGSLLQCGADMACTIAEADESTRSILNIYALNLSQAYQMIEDLVLDYSKGSEDFDIQDDYNSYSKSSYTSMMGFDKTRKIVESLLLECEKIIKPFPKNEILIEFIQMIRERLP